MNPLQLPHCNDLVKAVEDILPKEYNFFTLVATYHGPLLQLSLSHLDDDYQPVEITPVPSAVFAAVRALRDAEPHSAWTTMAFEYSQSSGKYYIQYGHDAPST